MLRKAPLALCLMLSLFFLLPKLSFAVVNAPFTPTAAPPSSLTQMIIGQGQTAAGQWYGDCSAPPLAPPTTTYVACNSVGPCPGICTTKVYNGALGWVWITPPQCGISGTPCGPYTGGTSASCACVAPTPPGAITAGAYYIPSDGYPSACTSPCASVSGSIQCSHSTTNAQPCTSCIPGSSNWCQIGTTQSLCPTGKSPVVVLSLTSAGSSSTTCTIASSTAASATGKTTVDSSGKYYDVQIQAQLTSTGGSCKNLASQFNWYVLCQ